MIKMNRNFKMTKKELTMFRTLDNDKPNMPDTKLNKEEVNFISTLYRKYITSNVDNIDWNLSLEEIERSERWPSGQKVTMIQAKRIVLGFLESINKRGDMTDKQAAKYFLSNLQRTRKSYMRLCYFAYN